MKKLVFDGRLIALPVVLIVTVFLLTVSAYAADEMLTGHIDKDYKSGETTTKIVNTDWSFNKSTKTLTLSSTSEGYNETGTPSYSESGAWKSFITEIEHIVIKTGIAKISAFAFDGAAALKTVELAEAVSQIDGVAFNGCAELTTIFYTGNAAVEGQADLSKMSKLAANTFSGVKKITSVVLGDKISSISGGGALPSSCTAIYGAVGSYAQTYAKDNGMDFYNAATKELVNQKTAAISGQLEYYYGTGESKVKTVDVTWKYDKETKTLTITSNNSGYNETGNTGCDTVNGAWAAYNSEIEKIVIGQGISKITAFGFRNCTALKTVEIPDSIGQIDQFAFFNCGCLTSVYLKGTTPVDGVADFRNIRTFGDYTFSKSGIGSLFVSEKMSSISANCGILASIDTIYAPKGSYGETYAKDNNLTFIDTDGATVKPNLKQTVVNKPDETQSSSGSSAASNAEQTIIAKGSEDSIIDCEKVAIDAEGVIGGVIDQQYSKFTWTIYKGVLRLDSTAKGYNDTGYWHKQLPPWQQYNTEIKKVYVSDGFAKLGTYVFSALNHVTLIELPADCTQIESFAFYGCTKLTEIRVRGHEYKEGFADLSTNNLGNTSKVIYGTAIENLVLCPGYKYSDTFFDGDYKLKNLYATIDDSIIEFCRTNLINLIDNTDATKKYDFWVYVDYSLPVCGNRTVYSFDKDTGTLTVLGVGPMGNIVNYYGGGSKTVWWFDIKNEIKKVVISEGVTTIGRYAFCQCKNLETVEIQAPSIVISNSAFEKCINLRSIYNKGSEPIEGTLDLRNVTEINSWSLSYLQCAENVIFSDSVAGLTPGVFDSSVSVKNIYGEKGTEIETFAKDYGYTFCDIALSMPSAVHLTANESLAEDTSSVETDETEPPVTFNEESATEPIDTEPPKSEDKSGSDTVLIIVFISVIVLAAAGAAVYLLVFAKKKKSTDKAVKTNGNNNNQK